MRIDYEVVEAGAVLLPSRSYLELVAAPGERASAELDLRNQGLRAVEGVTVALLDAITKQPLDWASLTTPAEIGRLEIGAEHPVGVRIAPTEAIPEDTHELLLRVAADNAEGFDIPVYAHVTRAGIGDVLFHVSDIYTATLDENGVPIPGLENARIEVQHEQFTDIQYNGRTDANGELLLTDLQAGRYLFRVSAANHADAQGRLTIEPGITASREVFLDYDLISLEWSVTEITIEDRYEITLDITYETDVPAPVVGHRAPRHHPAGDGAGAGLSRRADHHQLRPDPRRQRRLHPARRRSVLRLRVPGRGAGQLGGQATHHRALSNRRVAAAECRG